LLSRFIESGRIYHNGFIPAGMFQSVVTIRLLRGDHEEARQFIESHRHRIIGSQHPEEFYQYNLANYYFHVGQYNEALGILLRVSYEEMQYKFSSKILEIKILYETNSKLLDSKIDAAKIYFYREQHIPQDKKEMYSRFVDYMRRLIHPQTEVNLERAQKLLDEIRESPPIAEWPWLLVKTEQLVQKQQSKKR
jgi:tetratricopeptide (TPR) repeat protein